MRTRHLLLLSGLFVIYIVAMLAAHDQPSDERLYVQFARNLTDGYYTDRSAPNLWFGPGLPLLLTPFAFVDAPLEMMRLLGPVLLLTAVLLFYEVLRFRVSPRIALIGAASLGLYVPFYPLLPTLHSEIPAVLLVVVFMYALGRDAQKMRTGYILLAGAALALLALTRIVFGWIILAALVIWLAVWLVTRKRWMSRIVAVHAIALALCIPWLAYTYSISNNVFYWGSSGGLSLYWMASPYPGQLGDWHAVNEVFTNPGLAPNREYLARIRKTGNIEADKALRRDSVDLIEEHPEKYVRNVVANLSRMWFNTPYSFTPQKPATLYYILPNAFLLVGLVSSAVVMWLRRRAMPREVGPFLLLLLLGIGVQMLLAAFVRMLAPLVPLILWFILVVLGSQLKLSTARQCARPQSPTGIPVAQKE